MLGAGFATDVFPIVALSLVGIRLAQAQAREISSYHRDGKPRAISGCGELF
jgi:hypothetical protein